MLKNRHLRARMLAQALYSVHAAQKHKSITHIHSAAWRRTLQELNTTSALRVNVPKPYMQTYTDGSRLNTPDIFEGFPSYNVLLLTFHQRTSAPIQTQLRNHVSHIIRIQVHIWSPRSRARKHHAYKQSNITINQPSQKVAFRLFWSETALGKMRMEVWLLQVRQVGHVGQVRLVRRVRQVGQVGQVGQVRLDEDENWSKIRVFDYHLLQIWLQSEG